MTEDGDNLSMTKTELMQYCHTFTESFRQTNQALHKEVVYYRILVLIYTIGAVGWILFST